eukprot:2815161-Alexandrium_andersonii.AAC.2
MGEKGRIGDPHLVFTESASLVVAFVGLGRPRHAEGGEAASRPELLRFLRGCAQNARVQIA